MNDRGSDVGGSPEESRKVAERWSTVPCTNAFSPEVYWGAVPEVRERNRRRQVAGLDYEAWFAYCVGEFLAGRVPAERMLDVGCGIGNLDRALGKLGAFRRMDSYDLAEGAIDVARRRAAEEGISGIEYRVANVSDGALPERAYDAAWFSGSLHHVEALDDVLHNVARSLKPDGFLFVNEYVGPDRFDFGARQREVIDAAFRLIPHRFRRNFAVTGEPTPAAMPQLPDVAAVVEADPSEAVSSSQIVDAIGRHFEIVVRNPFGGTLLQFLLCGIAGNFRSDDPDSIRVLDLLFAVEDTLIAVGDLVNDFEIIVGRPRGRPPAPLGPRIPESPNRDSAAR